MNHIVVDLEMNIIGKKHPARAIWRQEIIEIGAVLMDDNLTEIAAFRTYVKPEYSDRIHPDVEKITGITYSMVENAPSFSEAFHMFTDWCLGTGKEFTIHAWSDSDYAQITHEMILKEYRPSKEEELITDIPWQDFQRTIDDYLGFERQISLQKALELAGIDFNGHAHDALDDARNTARLLSVHHDPVKIKEVLEKIREVMIPTPLGNSIGNMFDFSTLVFE